MKASFLLIFVFLCLIAKSQTVVPQKGSGSKFFLACANMYFEIDSARGARFTSFKLNDNEIIYVDFKTTDMAGSTFWPSPQSVWNWPPAVNLDGNPYKTSIKQNKIVFTSNIDTKSMLRFYKTISASAVDTSISIDYCIKNEKTTSQKWAPWEITRVLNGGLTVFAKGLGSVTGDMSPRTITTTGYVWYDQDKMKGSVGSKFFCDGKGWLAHVVNGDMLFIKQFDDVAYGKTAPAESEVEAYTAPDNSYTELEDQGAYTTIASKDSLTWHVKWFARELPASINVSVGSKGLTSYIEAVIKRELPTTQVNMAINNPVKIYPNPVARILTVETGLSICKDVSLRIIDLQGRIALTSSIIQTMDQINIEGLPSGYYIYDIQQGTKILSKGQLAIKH